MADAELNQLAAASALTGAELMLVEQGGVSKRTLVSDVRIIDVVKCLTATQANSTVTMAAATGLTVTGLAVGTYLIKVWICFRAAATTTGPEFRLNMATGAVSRMVNTWYTLTTGGAAATGVADQATTLTAQMLEGKGSRANASSGGPMQGVDTANSDQFAVMEGIVVVTTAGNLQFEFASEVAASAVTLMEGTTLTLQKVA